MPMDQRVAMPAQVDKVMGHLFQVFRLRFGHPKGRQAMNEEEAGDFCLALQAVISAKKLIALYEKHENHAFKQFVMTRLNNGPDSGGYIIQALREAWAADDYHAALAALRMAYQFLNAVEPDFNTAGPDGYHSPEPHRYAHLYSYQDTTEKPRYQILDGQAAPGLLNREYVEPEAEPKPPPTLEDMFLLTEEDMCDDGCSTERASDDDGTEKGFDTDEEEALDSIFEAVSLGEASSAAQGCDAGVINIAQGSPSGDETDLESVVIVGEDSDLYGLSDFESISDADGATESESCRPLLPAAKPTREDSASHTESVESPTQPITGAPLAAGPDTADIDTGWERESLVGLSSDDDYEQVVVEDWEIETEDLSSNMSGLSLTRPRP